MNYKFDVAVILINYNSSVHSVDCIQSIIERTGTGINYQIIVVDNCSKEEEYEYLEKFCRNLGFKYLTLLRSRINTGFGGGNMYGMQHADSRYLVFLNNDTLLKNDCLSILYQYMNTHPHVGITGAQSFKPDGEFIISFDHFASLKREILGRSFLELLNKRRYPRRKHKYDSPLEVDFVSGSFMMIQASDFYQTGGFDTNLFLFYEETDLGKRIKAAGKSTMLVPEAEYVHIHGASTPHSIQTKKELKISLLYVIRKHSGYTPYLILLTYLRIRYLFSCIFKPKYRELFSLFMGGAPLSASMKLKQKVNPNYPRHNMNVKPHLIFIRSSKPIIKEPDQSHSAEH